MSRGKRMVALALSATVEEQKEEGESTNYLKERFKRCFSADASVSEIAFFNPFVKNESDSTFVNGFCFDLEIVQREFLFFDYDDDDDDFVDPDYLPTDEDLNYDDNDIVPAAEELERNIFKPDNIREKSSDVEKETKRSRQEKRNLGKEYTTSTGKLVSKRKFKELESCRKGCKGKLTLHDQQAIFERYWSLGNLKLRQAHVSGLMEVQPKKCQRLCKNPAPRNRTHSCYYYLVKDGNRLSVCQKCFQFTLGESEQVLKTIAKKKINSAGGFTSPDKMGNRTPANKLSEDKVNEVRDHISSFPAYESHYTRMHSEQKYLASDLSLSQMYRLYKDSKYSKPVSFTKYVEIFKTMKLKIKSPQLDSCHTCEILSLKLKAATEEDVVNLRGQQEAHHYEADLAYQQKAKDKNLSKEDASIKVFTFDLQQCLPTPYLRTSVSFYKRPLWTYNLTIHDCASDQPFCYMWHEATAKRGGNEIASCLAKHIQNISHEVDHLIFYSDNCSGQNKNSFVSAMFMAVIGINNSISTIDHKFLTPGHTHMECDTDHALIERKKKKSFATIHHPRDWYQFVASVGVKKHFIVYEMKQEDFLDFAKVSKNQIIWRKVNQDGERFTWRDVKWLGYTSEFGLIQYKNSLNEEEPFKLLNVRKRGVNKIEITNIGRCYEESIPINIEKKKDLIEMLPIIDTSFHNFYLNLRTNDIPLYHPDLTEETEIE